MEFNPENISLIVGIGNPDSSYDGTYHNVGLWFAKELMGYLSSLHFTEDDSSGGGVRLFSSPDSPLKVGVSEVYMNRSAKAVGSALSLAEASPEHLLLVHDDSDIALGSYSFSFGRGSAGHNGVSSVQGAVGKDFWRLRIGIRDEETARTKAGDFVLEEISKEHHAVLSETFQTIFKEIIPPGQNSKKT